MTVSFPRPLSPTGQSASRPGRVTLLLGAAAVALSACGAGGFDWDVRQRGDGFTTREAARTATAQRPSPDARGVISYPGYQVAVARRGDTVATVAERIGLPATELAQFNALEPGTPMRQGEILALPSRVPESGAGPIQPAGEIDIAALAGPAIDAADPPRGPRVIGGTGDRIDPAQTAGTAAPAAGAQAGFQPIRHQVARGETAFSIARLYNVTTRALADWNGLGADMTVREGQFLLVPVPDRASGTSAQGQAAAAGTSSPGQGTPVPAPPSASRPLPLDDPASASPSPGPQAAATPPPETPAPAARPATTPERAPEPTASGAPPSPNLGDDRTAGSGGQLAMPVQGRIVRPYVRGSNDGIGIAASAGAAVRAAADGTVAAVTRDTGQVPILVVRHESLDLMTVYVNLDDISVERGARVSRGQSIGTVGSGDPAVLHFEVRRGFESVDPVPFLQ